MKRCFICLLFMLVAVLCNAQSLKKLQQQAATERDLGNYDKAIELSAQALAMAQSDNKIKPGELLALRSENAACYLLSEQVEKGMALFAPILKEMEDSQDVFAEMSVRQNYGIALVFLTDYVNALPQLEKAVALGKEYGMKAVDLINVMGSLALCYQSQYDFQRSESLFKETIALCKKEGLAKSTEHATLLNNLAYLYRDMQLSTKALDCYEQAEKVFVGAKDTLSPSFSAFLMEYGALLAEIAQYDKALSYTFRSRDLSRHIFTESSNEYAGTLNNLGFIYGRMNRLVETEQFYQKAINIKKSLPYQRLDGYLTTVSNLMVFCSNVGRNEEAVSLSGELEAGLKNKELTDTLKRATFAYNIAVTSMQLHDHNKAHRYFKEALMYYEAVYGPDNEFAAEIYVDMGTLLQVQENYDDCVKSLNKAAGIYSKTLGGEGPDKIGMICNLAMILHNMGQDKAAEPYVNKAIEIADRYKVANADVLEQLYMSKAQVAADLDQVKEAMDYFNKYLSLKYEQIDQNFGYMTENEKMLFLEQFEQNIRNFYTTILNNIDKYPELIKTLLDFRLKTKGLLLNNLSKIRERIIELNDAVLNEKFEQMKLKRETVSKLLLFDAGEYPYALAEATALKSEADQLEKEISLRVSGNIKQLQNMNWRSIQQQLKPGEAAIEVFQSYLVYHKGQGRGTNYTYIILKPVGDPVAVSIDRFIAWESEVLDLYRNSINAKKDEPDLYRRLWKPVDEQLRGITTVYVSPDGIYNQINLNTLMNGDTKKYILEEKEIHLMTSLRDLGGLKQSGVKKPLSSVLVGNPKFDLDVTRLDAKQQQSSATALATRGAYGFVLDELPGTKQEIDVIRTTLETNKVSSLVFTEEKANERDIKKIKDPDVLHIATHGFFLEDPDDASLAGYAKIEKEYYRNPMLRSGIFFSGANKNYAINTANIGALSDFEDGMLTAYEAMNMKLDKTELVVLSACQTGLGKVKNGEGVYGLQRAFRMAGARSIIMSLWPVSDEATKDLMISFYSNWTRTGDLYAAFKTAQLEVKAKYPQPYYWGAFVLNGK